MNWFKLCLFIGWLIVMIAFSVLGFITIGTNQITFEAKFFAIYILTIGVFLITAFLGIAFDE